MNQEGKSPLKTHIIGLGRMGNCHAKAVLMLGWQITGVCDRSAEQLAKFANQYALNKSQCYLNCEQMLAHSDKPDLLIIATTADTHCELTCLAAHYGVKRILCEKPMATSLADCTRMINACQQSESLLAINHQMRFMPQYQLVKKYTLGDRFGSLASMNVVAGCFGLSMNGSHYIEAFSYLTNSQPNSVTAWFSEEPLKNPRGEHFLDQAGQMRVLSNNGQRLMIEVGNDQGHGLTATYATRYGYIFVDELGGKLYAVARKKEYIDKSVMLYGLPNDCWEKFFTPPENVSCTKEVLSALVTGERYPSGEDGRIVINTLVAAYYSAQHGNQAIALDDPRLIREQQFPWG